MIEIAFKDFYLSEFQEGFYELYIMKNWLDEILYVGISSQDLWSRWFGWNGHITGNDKFMIGNSTVGKKIEAACQILGNGKFNYGLLKIAQCFVQMI